MANDPKAVEGGEAPPPKSKKLLIIIVALVLILAIAGGAAALLLKKKASGDENADDEEVATETSKAKKKDKKKDDHAHPPVFVNLDPFTVNLVPDTAGDQYLQVALSVEFEDPAGEAQMKANIPKIRNSITLLLSGKKSSELAPREGKEKLARELKDAINLILEPPPPPKKGKPATEAEVEGPAKEVLFTSFIIQ